MAAVAAGIRHVQGTINGYGERAGNANMVSILANLALKTEHELVPAGGGRLDGLTELSRSVAEIANVTPNDYQPYVGRSAFAHKGGVHGAAVAKVERSYQHVEPGSVGNSGRLVVSELGGRANTSIRARQLGHELEGVVDPRELSQLIKQLESEGLAFEGAEASFELLIRRHAADYAAPFRIVDYTCLVEQRDGRELLAEATVKVEVAGETLHTAADGNGPVNALDAALRKALRAFYPAIDDVHLVDYKVRILDGDAATAARTRVIINSQDGARTWSTMGSDTNIIAASAAALADSLEYAIWKSGAELRRRDERHFTTSDPRGGGGRRASRPGRRSDLRADPGTRPSDATEVSPHARPRPAAAPLRLARWTVSSGSNARSRGAVIIDSGDHHWQASAEGNGAIDALYRAVDDGHLRGARRAPAATGLRHPRPGGGHRHDRRRQRADRAAARLRRARRGRVRRARRAGRTSSLPRSRRISWR